MDLINWPAWTDSEKLWYGLLAATWVLVPTLEGTGLSFIRYSKFRRASGISGRTGMIILYVIPLLVAIGYFAYHLPRANVAEWGVASLLIVHFGKRVLESAFLHRYSGTIDMFSVSQIAFFYSLVVWIVEMTTLRTPQGLDAVFFVGMALFVIGQVGNFVHHRILANLRSGDDKEYVLPKGGLFSRVACPHYLLELVSWLGICLVSRQVGSYICFLGICAYLTVRARKTLTWYRGKFTTLPNDWTSIVPGVF